MKLSEELAWRGFIQDTTLSDISKLDEGKWTFYHGFDASSDSQQVGNLAAMMLDKAFIRHGHRAILLAGGATSLIGDPGGKDKERPMQDSKVIAGNIKKAEEQIKKIFRRQRYTLVNNLDWMKDMKLLPFLRDIGKHFSMTPLVQRDYIAQRIGEGGSGISYTEFSYTILQGYDYLHLYDKYGCTLQLGASDQWGNCLSGVDLIRRVRGAEVHVLTLPLIINKSTGKKFGKSEEGAIWLDEDKTSVYKFYQFWLNVDDESAEGYLKVFTELDKPQIDDIMSFFAKDKSTRHAQKTLAYEVTKLVHGHDRADSVKRISEVLFGKGDYRSLRKKDFMFIKQELPVAKAKIGQELKSVLVQAGLASSRSEAIRYLSQNAVYLNGQQVESGRTLKKEDRLDGKHVILRRGKNVNAVIEVS